jgi:hypothetical protein
MCSFIVQTRTILDIWGKHFNELFVFYEKIYEYFEVAITRYNKCLIIFLIKKILHSIKYKCYINISFFITLEHITFFIEYHDKSGCSEILIESILCSSISDKIVCFLDMILVTKIYPKSIIIEIPSESTIEVLSIDKCNIMYFLMIHARIIWKIKKNPLENLSRNRSITSSSEKSQAIRSQ